MAKYVPGPFVGELSRSQGNTTYSHNRFGAYTRNRTIPVNPNTAGQTAMRADLSSIAQSWRTLTPTARADWEALGAQIPRVDSLGQTYFLNGFGAFLYVNRNNVWRGGVIATAAPILAIAPNVNPTTLVADVSLAEITLTYTGTVAIGDFLVIEATRPVSQGVNFAGRGEYKAIAIVAAAASPQTFGAAYIALYGPFLAGEKIFVRTRQITAAGFSGTPELINTIAVP